MSPGLGTLGSCLAAGEAGKLPQGGNEVGGQERPGAYCGRTLAVCWRSAVGAPHRMSAKMGYEVSVVRLRHTHQSANPRSTLASCLM
eukprot:scaffold100500_cov25-Tisochrysis_lutea.AAC.1